MVSECVFRREGSIVKGQAVGLALVYTPVVAAILKWRHHPKGGVIWGEGGETKPNKKEDEESFIVNVNSSQWGLSLLSAHFTTSKTTETYRHMQHVKKTSCCWAPLKGRTVWSHAPWLAGDGVPMRVMNMFHIKTGSGFFHARSIAISPHPPSSLDC